MKRLSVVMVLSGLLAACSGASGSDGGTGGGAAGGTATGGGSATGGGGEVSGPDLDVGTFTVSLVSPAATPNDAGYLTVVGKVYDGPSPELVIWEKSSESGSCQLLKPRVPFCNPACGGSAACVETNTCLAYPKAQSAGAVTVKGLGSAEFQMTPLANTYQPPTTVELPDTALSASSTVRLEAAGATFPAFAVQAGGIGELKLSNGTIALQNNQAVTLSWPAGGATSRVHVKLDVSHHGGSKGKIECDAADTGSLELTGAMVTELLGLGVAGFPSIQVSRQSTGVTQTTVGKVHLVIESTVEREVTIAGLVSCNEDGDCPTGQTCQTDLSCK